MVRKKTLHEPSQDYSLSRCGTSHAQEEHKWWVLAQGHHVFRCAILIHMQTCALLILSLSLPPWQAFDVMYAVVLPILIRAMAVGGLLKAPQPKAQAPALPREDRTKAPEMSKVLQDTPRTSF